jgi:hypothetical protein
MTYLVMTRAQYEVNTDPQRRCYYGCHAKSEWVWTPWETLERPESLERANHKLKFWTELNDYAVSQRGPRAKREFKIVTPDEETI